jgi:hypothetical protein
MGLEIGILKALSLRVITGTAFKQKSTGRFWEFLSIGLHRRGDDGHSIR